MLYKIHVCMYMYVCRLVSIYIQVYYHLSKYTMLIAKFIENNISDILYRNLIKSDNKKICWFETGEKYTNFG